MDRRRNTKERELAAWNKQGTWCVSTCWLSDMNRGSAHTRISIFTLPWQNWADFALWWSSCTAFRHRCRQTSGTLHCFSQAPDVHMGVMQCLWATLSCQKCQCIVLDSAECAAKRKGLASPAEQETTAAVLLTDIINSVSWLLPKILLFTVWLSIDHP